jgi:hypothetical protein
VSGTAGWTVGDLRRALDGVPDDLPAHVNVTTTDVHGQPEGFLPVAITGADVGMTNVGTDGEPEPYSFFEIKLEPTDIGGALLYVPLPEQQ